MVEQAQGQEKIKDLLGDEAPLSIKDELAAIYGDDKATKKTGKKNLGLSNETVGHEISRIKDLKNRKYAKADFFKFEEVDFIWLVERLTGRP